MRREFRQPYAGALHRSARLLRLAAGVLAHSRHAVNESAGGWRYYDGLIAEETS